jgi:hypothetical protein
MGEVRSWPAYPIYGNSWHADIEETTAYLYEAKGRFSDAEAAYRAQKLKARLVV